MGKIKNLSENILKKIDDFACKNKLNDLFQKESELFITEDLKNDFYGIRDFESKTILFRKNDKVLCGMILTLTKQKFKIIETDNTPAEYTNAILPNTKLECFRVQYEVISEKPFKQPQQSTVINQNVTVYGDNNAPINQVAISNLDDLEKRIKEFNPNIFQKKKHGDILLMFGSFKDCIINQKRDEPFFKKFLSALASLLPNAVKLAEQIISALF